MQNNHVVRWLVPFAAAWALASGCSGAEPSTFCGGIAGIACPDGQRCVDDPSDDCDPNNGGADCGGICVGGGTPTNPCAAVLCEAGTECIAEGGSARCVPINEKCGDVVCPAGTECCNPLMSICVRPGMVCIQ